MQTLHVLDENGSYRVAQRFGLESRTHASASMAIQSAIDQANARGGRVVIEPGEFPLDLPIELRPAVDLVGSGRGTHLVVSSANPAGIAIHGVKAHHASLRDFVIRPKQRSGGKTGVLLEACGHTTLDKLTVAGFAHHGIMLTRSSFLTQVTDCTAASNGKSNFHFHRLATGGEDGYGDYIPNLVNGCIAVGGGVGFLLDNALVINFTGCAAYQTAAAGFSLLDRSNSVMISGCRTFQCGAQAVYIESTYETSLAGNIFCWHQEEGVRIVDALWGSVTGNNIIDSGSFNPGGPDRTTNVRDLSLRPPRHHAISLHDVHGHAITGNAIFNWPVCPAGEAGVYQDDRCTENTVVGNNVNFFATCTATKSPHPGCSVANHSSPYCHHAKRHPAMPEHAKILQSFRPELTNAFVDALWAANAKTC